MGLLVEGFKKETISLLRKMETRRWSRVSALGKEGLYLCLNLRRSFESRNTRLIIIIRKEKREGIREEWLEIGL